MNFKSNVSIYLLYITFSAYEHCPKHHSHCGCKQRPNSRVYYASLTNAVEPVSMTKQTISCKSIESTE